MDFLLFKESYVDFLIFILNEKLMRHVFENNKYIKYIKTRLNINAV